MQVVNLLKLAAEERCDYSCSIEASSSRRERKLKEKRNKALATVEDILGRGIDGSDSPKQLLYDSMASLISERAALREMWSDRENDSVFKRMDAGCQPIPFPVIFNCNGNATNDANDVGQSPLGGSPEFLKNLAEDIKVWGDCYESKDRSKLPSNDSLVSHLEAGTEYRLAWERSSTFAVQDPCLAKRDTDRNNDEVAPVSENIENPKVRRSNKKKDRKRKQCQNRGSSDQAKKKKKRY